MRAAPSVFLVALAIAGVARADPPSQAASDDVRDTASSEEAKEHFETALVYYRAGKYRSAIVELEKAYGVDPTGKDLVYNLAVVYEKLGELDSAIHYLERYVALEPDPDEVKRANDTIQRLRGAREELERDGEPRRPPPCPPAPVTQRTLRSGVFDEWVALTGGVAVVSALVGTVFGLRALDLHPGPSDVTGAGESREEMRERAMTASSLARVADVAFALSVVSGSAAAVLYFGRSTETERAPAAMTFGVAGRF